MTPLEDQAKAEALTERVEEDRIQGGMQDQAQRQTEMDAAFSAPKPTQVDEDS